MKQTKKITLPGLLGMMLASDCVLARNTAQRYDALL
jgi:hypothetical protein